jgi:entry exclusion lipoprotein TrbK
MVLLVAVLLLTVTLTGCGSHTARLEHVDDENCRRIVAERDQKDQFIYQKCRANLMRYRDQDAVADNGR